MPSPIKMRTDYPPAPTVNQPILPALLESVAQAPEMALAEPKKLARFDTTQASRPMRSNRIQNTRHPNLRQHAVLRSKNRTNHVLPKPDISCARDSARDMRLTEPRLPAMFSPNKGAAQ